MRQSTILAITFLLTFSLTRSDDFSCQKLFKKDYQIFFFTSEVANPFTTQKTIKPDHLSDQVTGDIYTSICGQVEIPNECSLHEGKAKFVFQSRENLGNCIVIKEEGDWTFTLNKELEQQVISIKKDDEHIKLTYTFKCEVGNDSPDVNVLYFPNKKEFEVTVNSLDGCGIKLDFLKVLSENPLVTAVVFAVLGSILCFFGLKFYKDFLIFFIPLIILILGFYLYMALVEKSLQHNDKLFLIIAMIFCLMIVVVLTVMFSSMIYLLLSFLVSYELGLIAHSLAEKHYEFFTKDYTEWIFIIVFFAMLFGFYLALKDYFIILGTSILGSSFLIISLPYFGLSEFEFLFDIEMNKFNDIKHLDNNHLNILVLFGMVTLLGILMQFVMFKRGSSKDNNEDIKIDLQMSV